MTTGMSTVIYPVHDLGRAKAVYGALLGSAPVTEEPYYVGFAVAGHDVGLDPHGHRKGMTGPVGYRPVDDLEARLQALLDGGAELHQVIRDVGGGKLIASVTDPDGNVIGLLQSR
jgi:predicted enzyme related to lactoylglutathione lyase